ncbi:hypothetical protein ES703_73021 [subsurface metagenome]
MVGSASAVVSSISLASSFASGSAETCACISSFAVLPSVSASLDSCGCSAGCGVGCSIFSPLVEGSVGSFTSGTTATVPPSFGSAIIFSTSASLSNSLSRNSSGLSDLSCCASASCIGSLGPGVFCGSAGAVSCASNPDGRLGSAGCNGCLGSFDSFGSAGCRAAISLSRIRPMAAIIFSSSSAGATAITASS